jgi:raffinose/stachyose/melibiose transport system permease protein
MSSKTTTTGRKTNPDRTAPAERGGKSRESWYAAGTVGARRRTTALAIIPALALTALFLFIPALQGIRTSLSTWKGFGPLHYVGFQNYTDALHNAIFWQAMSRTVQYTVLSTAGIVVLGLLLAAAVSAQTPGYRFYRVVWFIPGVAPIAAGAVFWASAFQPNQGVVNVVLGAIGLGNAHSWLADASLALYPTIFVTIWVHVGFAFLLLLGAMEQIPVSLYEAARVDGVGRVRTFSAITLPLIRPVLVIVTILEIIWNFNSFTVMYAMTKGGPGYATTTLPVLVYREAFQNLNFGPASAMAMLGSLVLLAMGAVSVRLNKSMQSA